MVKEKNILLICPSFFDYYKDIAFSLQKLNYKVFWYDDRPSSSLLSKAMIRLNKSLQKFKIQKYLNEIISQTNGINFSYVLIILGQCFSADDISLLKAFHPESQFIYYTWDSIKNFPSSLEIAKKCDSAFSFDNEDCKKYGLKLLPLFFTKKYSKSESKYTFSTILTIKPGKLSNYKMIREHIPSLYYNNSFEYLYLQSKLVFYYFKHKYPEFKSAKANDFKYKKLNRETYYNIICHSKVVIDCQMNNQIGLTMRTFEALSQKKKLITTNQNIKNYDFYSPQNIFVVNKETKEIPSSFFDINFDDKYTLSNIYYIDNFVRRLLNLEIIS